MHSSQYAFTTAFLVLFLYLLASARTSATAARAASFFVASVRAASQALYALSDDLSFPPKPVLPASIRPLLSMIVLAPCQAGSVQRNDGSDTAMPSPSIAFLRLASLR